MNKTKATLTQKEPISYDGKKWKYQESSFEVYVLATADGYAMVRRKGCIPFVCRAKELTLKDKASA